MSKLLIDLEIESNDGKDQLAQEKYKFETRLLHLESEVCIVMIVCFWQCSFDQDIPSRYFCSRSLFCLHTLIDVWVWSVCIQAAEWAAREQKYVQEKQAFQKQLEVCFQAARNSLIFFVGLLSFFLSFFLVLFTVLTQHTHPACGHLVL